MTIPQRKGDPIVVAKDEHPRAGTTLEALAKLPTPFREGGTVTAGNASGVNDGAAALIIASEAAAKKYGLTPIARILGGAAAGVAPRIMGIGPAPATQKLCARLGLKPTDFDVIELNEAFASQGIAVLRELGIPEDAAHVNPNGGAIALGHPLGMSRRAHRRHGGAGTQRARREARARDDVHRRRPGHRDGAGAGLAGSVSLSARFAGAVIRHIDFGFLGRLDQGFACVRRRAMTVENLEAGVDGVAMPGPAIERPHRQQAIRGFARRADMPVFSDMAEFHGYRRAEWLVVAVHISHPPPRRSEGDRRLGRVPHASRRWRPDTRYLR